MITRRNWGKTNIAALGILAIVVIALAAGVYMTQNKSTEAKFKPSKLFKKIDMKEVAEVKLTGLTDTVVLKKQGDEVWGLESRGGYPVDKEKMRRLVYSVANLEPADKMTEDPKKYEKLGVTDEKPEKGRVQLLDSKGKVLAGLFVGQDRKAADDGSGAGFRPADGQYVRAEGDPAVYKIKEEIAVDVNPLTWLNKELVKVEEKEIQSVKVDHGDTTATFSLTRTGIDPFKFVNEIPAGMREKPGISSSVARAITSLTLKDVLPPDDPKAADIKFGGTYRATMKNGLVYNIVTGESGGNRYAKVSADYDKGADFSIKDERTSDTVTAKAMELAETTKTKFNDKMGKWIFQLDTWVFDNLGKKWGEVIEPIPPPAKVQPGGPGGPGGPHAGGPPMGGAGGLPEGIDQETLQKMLEQGGPPGGP